MDSLHMLSPARCILLASSLTTHGYIAQLRCLTSTRPEVFNKEITLRILLSCLPECLDPSNYTDLIREIALDREPCTKADYTNVDLSSVLKISEKDVRRQVRQLHLRPLDNPDESVESVPDDLLVQFLISWTRTIADTTAHLPSVPRLLIPFLDHSPYLRSWFISAVLPLLRFDFEYYPQDGPTTGLSTFESLEGLHALHVLLSRSVQASDEGAASADTVGRDLRGIVGPWTYGASRRKRRKLHSHPSSSGVLGAPSVPKDDSPSFRRNDTAPSNDIDQEWDYTFHWITSTAMGNFPLAVHALNGWDGPEDVDLDGYENGNHTRSHKSDADFTLLHLKYCQSAFASVYAAEDDSNEVIRGSHTILTRLAHLLDYQSPNRLTTDVTALPSAEHSFIAPSQLPKDFLHQNMLMMPSNILTYPGTESFHFLHLMIHTAHLLSDLGYIVSIAKAARLRFWSDESEQLRVIQRMISGLIDRPKMPQAHWLQARQRLLWLWSWRTDVQKEQQHGNGIFCSITRTALEQEILRALCLAGQLGAAVEIYKDSTAAPLDPSDVESVIVNTAILHFDKASNGNRTRGSMKKAADLLSAFQSELPNSQRLRQLQALISATHALSFYALTLEKGIPLQPARLRQIKDPVGLINKVLEQNPGSYTKLDDLLQIAKNLVISFESSTTAFASNMKAADNDESELMLNTAGDITRLVVKSALAEDDFETAYSYVINRLSSPDVESLESQDPEHRMVEDDTSWRAAFDAGRHRTSPQARKQGSNPPDFALRHLEQRMELLARAMSLAPAPALPEILAAWRRCEEELNTILSDEEDDQSIGSKGTGPRSVPGDFNAAPDPRFSVQPQRKEFGRGVAEEAPMGLFEVARGAAAAFGRSAGDVMGNQATKSRAVSGMRTSSASSHQAERTKTTEGEEDTWGEWGEEDANESDTINSRKDRVRKRDQVANLVTGGLASGIGWVIGATPLDERQRPQQ